MLNRYFLFKAVLLCAVGFVQVAAGQQLNRGFSELKTLKIDSGVTLSFDEPVVINKKQPTELIIFALPNGNSTAQTFGKKIVEGDDWHFDIQHIGAQTAFIRNTDPSKNYIVVYVENSLKSWPAWRSRFAKSNGDDRIVDIVETIMNKYQQYHPKLTLTAHSGGGSLLFGYLNAQSTLPRNLHRIAFLDATYGYDTEKHNQKLTNWLKDKKHRLEVISYNDSVVVYNGKPLVSPTGGTWYRSKLMAADLKLNEVELADRFTYNSKQAEFIRIKNPEGKIYHTVLVEKNGFIHSIFKGTAFENNGYQFWGERAYANLIVN